MEKRCGASPSGGEKGPPGDRPATVNRAAAVEHRRTQIGQQIIVIGQAPPSTMDGGEGVLYDVLSRLLVSHQKESETDEAKTMSGEQLGDGGVAW